MVRAIEGSTVVVTGAGGGIGRGIALRFAMAGARLALQHELALFGTTLLAFLTAVGGGLLRDSLIGDVPVVLKSGFYGIIAVGVGLAVYAADRLALAPDVTLVAIFLGAVGLRLVAHARGWSLPVLTLPEE